MRALPALAVLLALAATPAPAQEDLPDPGMPEGAVQTAATDNAYDVYEVPVGRFTRWVRSVLPVEGRVVSRAFRLDGSGVTSAAVMATLRAGLEEQGFTELHACAGAACGGFDFRFATPVLPAPAMVVDLADFHQLSMRREGEGEGGTVYVSVLVSRALGSVYGQTVVAVPAENPVGRSPSPAVGEAEAAPALPHSEGAVEHLLERLTETGHVVVNGLDFKTGSAEIADTSAPLLDLLAQMLKDNAELAVAVVGHSDNVGGLEANLRLSRARAQSVVNALVERGVAASRLEAEGIAYLAPLASNATEEGRATNRRVELVLR